jgi:phosphotransferase system HPr (HPr) family protein
MAVPEADPRPEREDTGLRSLEVTRAVRIPNAAGLHARPCHAIVSKALAHESELWVSCEGREVNGKSILELMTLSAPFDATITFRAKGADAKKLVDELTALVDAGFDELER